MISGRATFGGTNVNECGPFKGSNLGGMAPSPDHDAAPKAPDKGRTCGMNKEKTKEEKTLSDLNDGELKGLLDEALNYKNPKDREGKSKLFNHLLNEAEEDERNARAARAGGSELVRYCNPSAKRNSRHRKKPSSISENMMHGGSLDNLAKEELFETSKHRTKKSVSARQREGGSLPCNVNSSTSVPHHYQFLEEARKKKEMSEKKNNDVESQSLIENDSLDQNFQEQSIEIPYKFTTRATLHVNVSEYGDIDRNRTVEKKGLHPRVPVFHVFMSRGGPDTDNGVVDSPIQIPQLEQADRKLSTNKVNTQGSDCLAPALKISNEGKVILKNLGCSITNCDRQKVDENGNALHQTVKTKKKKVLSDKNVFVCNSEQVKGHRSDIINDMDKILEFIGIGNDQTERSRPTKTKQLNRHPSDEGKSKKRMHPTKGKETRSKLQKSNSLSEISTTNLNDFEFGKDKVVLRGFKPSSEKPRERRSWGNMEPLPLQNLYSNASAENLESAEFRVVTKKKKSKKRRNSVSGRSKTSSLPCGNIITSHPSPTLRRKSACSVPHSEKSNDSSDVDSVHSLPIDTQRLDLSSPRLPISYAEMAKNNDVKPKEKKLVNTNDKVPKELTDNNNKYVWNQNICDSIKSNSYDVSVVKNSPPDVHNFKNFPTITKQMTVATTAAQICGKSNKNTTTVKNFNIGKNIHVEHQTDIQDELVNFDDEDIGYSSSLPPNIPDVQTIEKLQMIGQGHPSNYYNNNNINNNNNNNLNNGNDCSSVNCDINERTHDIGGRPPVVIISGYANRQEVPGLVFGFDINEQLLSEDNGSTCYDEFISRYMAPEGFTETSHNHDKIVHFIGAAWEDAVVNLSTGKVQYYTDIV